MCNDTKRKIAAAVIDMMRTRPVSKITVQQIMEQTQMKRQSFYYHYQDIYDVLEWIVTTDVCGPLQYDETQPLTDWCEEALTLLHDKQPLLRKISLSLGSDKMYCLMCGILRPQLARLLPEDTCGDEIHALALDTLCWGTFHTLNSMVTGRAPIDVELSMQKLQALMSAARGF